MQVVATSGVWEVMTPQEVVDFVHQCRQCQPDSLSCSAALTMEAHTRWKLRFAKASLPFPVPCVSHTIAMGCPQFPNTVRHAKYTVWLGLMALSIGDVW